MEALCVSHSCTSCGATWQPQHQALGQGAEGPWESWLLQWSSAPCLDWSFPAWPCCCCSALAQVMTLLPWGSQQSLHPLPPVRSVQGRRERPSSEAHTSGTPSMTFNQQTTGFIIIIMKRRGKQAVLSFKHFG